MTMAKMVCLGCGSAAQFMARLVFALATGGLVVFAAGCTVERRPLPPVLPALVTQQIPLVIGVHYTLEFRMARPVAGNAVWKVGDASVALFNSTLGGMFREVVQVERWPPTTSRPAVAGVVIPTVLDAGGEWAESIISYQVDLFSSAGARVGSWKVTGRSIVDSSIFSSEREERVRQAMRIAAADLIASFFREPQARAWLMANGVSLENLR